MLRSLASVGGLVVVGMVVAGLASAAWSQGRQPNGTEQGRVSIEGQYVCEGQAPGGGVYRGTTRIVRERDAYRMTWQIGSESHEGVGLLNGDLLSVSWRTGDTGGVVVYTVRRQGSGLRLEGKWTYFGANGQVLDETLTTR